MMGSHMDNVGIIVYGVVFTIISFVVIQNAHPDYNHEIVLLLALLPSYWGAVGTWGLTKRFFVKEEDE